MGLRTLKGRTRRLQTKTLSSEVQHSAIHPYQIMEQVKPGGHESDDKLEEPARKFSFQKQVSWTQTCKSLYCSKSRLDAICNHTRDALSKANKKPAKA